MFYLYLFLVNVLSFLFYLKERLFDRVNFNIVGSDKILQHVRFFLAISLIELVRLRTHIPSDSVNLVCSMGTILSHNNSPFELSVDIFVVISFQSFINEIEAVFD